jgi:signal transduction histidine kinase
LAFRSRWFIRPSLFGKYAATFVSLVIAVLVISGATEAWFTYHERNTEYVRSLTEKADTGGQKVEELLETIERQVSWAARQGVSAEEERQDDYTLILEHMPAVRAVTWFDGTGKTLRVTRETTAPDHRNTRPQPPDFSGTIPENLHYGPVVFADDGPQLQVTIGHEKPDTGATVADIELKYLSDILYAIQGDASVSAYVVTPAGRLVAHTNPSFMAHHPNLSALPQIAWLAKTTRSYDAMGRDVDGADVLTAAVPLPKLNAWLFVEAPQSAAMAPFYEFFKRLAGLIAFALFGCIVAGLVLGRRMTVPIKALSAGAKRLANGDFSQRIEVHTGDEIEDLADDFNRMALQVQESRARLEQKVEDRTRDLAQSVRELQALEEVGRALAASLDLNEVLATILSRSVELAGADGGAIYRFDPRRAAFTLAQAHGLDPKFIAAIREIRLKTSNLLSEVATRGVPVQVPQIAEAANFPLRGATLRAGFQSALIVPLIGSGELFGTLIVERHRAGLFPASRVGLMQTFADQSVLAMRNAQLFRQVEDKNKQLALANEHKSLFFANMSHELRTPLNAVLGYAELLQDGLYGELPERAKGVLERVESNGKHLLGLIDDILSLAKIEAGELSLALADYSMRNVVETVVASTGSLAAAKHLRVDTEIAANLPIGRGDERRLTQVFLNIVSNAIKFTDQGSVTLSVDAADDRFVIAIRDTGPGIAAEDQARIFEAFQQGDNTITKQKGGTGLGLSISKRFVDMHGGTISVASVLGEGSTFHINLPVRVDRQSEAA